MRRWSEVGAGPPTHERLPLAAAIRHCEWHRRGLARCHPLDREIDRAAVARHGDRLTTGDRLACYGHLRVLERPEAQGLEWVRLLGVERRCLDMGRQFPAAYGCGDLVRWSWRTLVDGDGERDHDRCRDAGL